MDPRQIAATALLEMEREGSYSNLVLEPYFEREKLSPRDRAAATALFYGVLERRITLDWALSGYSRTPIPRLEPEVRAALRLGAWQLLYSPGTPAHAAVSESVQLVKKLGKSRAAGLVNGILRAMVRSGCSCPTPKDRLTALSVEYSVPAPLIQRWRRAYGHQTALEILEGTQGPAPTFVRVNTVRSDLPTLQKRLEGEGVQTRQVPGVEDALELVGPGRFAQLPSFREGLFHVQDISSQLCAAALDPKPGMAVLDLCAAPGGKSFTIAQRMENKGRVLARDLHPGRLALVEEGASRLGLSIIETAPGDAQVPDPRLAGQFDRVLCDVVCSGLGTLRRKPEIRYKPLESLDGLPQIQYNILENSFQYLRAGGRLVYSTCTLDPAENEEVVGRLLENHPEIIAAAPPRTLIHGRDGLDCDGFFIAVLVRKEDVP